jgi:hypothetical protein
MSEARPEGPLTTLTHARLRALQGDVGAARRILTAVLEQAPDDSEARTLLEELAGRGSGPRPAEAEQVPERPPERGDPAEMAARFKGVLGGGSDDPGRVVRRLERWLERVQRNASASLVRG